MSMAGAVLGAESPEDTARLKIKNLQTLINAAEKKGIDVQQEEMTVRTAEVFLKYADWDEAHIEENAGYFKDFRIYKDNAQQLAEELPDFERNDVIKMLDESGVYLQQLIRGRAVRKPSPRIDWAGVTHDGDQLMFKQRPVFLADYTWKPDLPELNEFFGQQDGFYISPTQITDESGAINPSILKELKSKSDGKPGFIFINHGALPKWVTKKYGEAFTQFEGAPFHAYDIDHPGARDMISMLLKGTVPSMAGKKYTELGYMLCNEPRWITYKNGGKKVFYTGGVSDYTKKKFKVWLKKKHGSIAGLNRHWKTSFSGFDQVQLDIPIDISMVGTAQWYDWNAFNDDRVLEWFQFMKAELRKNDPAAKVHLKIMPSFFTDNDPCTGIDLEALTEMSEIIGNDCAAQYNNLRETAEWEEHYAFGWRELYMAYDFLKSVNPGQIVYNTESHLLSTGYSRDLYMDPAYARAVTWAAHTLGLSASQIWFWPRREDGSIRKRVGKGYPGSNNQQPRVTQAIHSTMMDLNAYSEEIIAMQRQRKPLRIFYSKTAAIQQRDYMDRIFDLYESLNFSGVSLGFATKNIITRHDNRSWEAILVHQSERVTLAEHAALQRYLDHGGTVILGPNSLKSNEYGEVLPSLIPGNGVLLQVGSRAEIKETALGLLADRNQLPEVEVMETNENGTKGCTWKCIKNSSGNIVISLVNLGNTDATINLQFRKADTQFRCRDLIHGTSISSAPVLKPYEVLFMEIQVAADQ
ncbi:alpha-amylase family protein [Pontiella agarivorans]|uniref:Beta-galactosidase n=1 Tax=Pontiella agarivorans TaxID=3038953 RepID=A0ABU5MS69_9BACT|nr:alpha-amylase family protein [Pontiella agarivorans]MDZ8117054.1 beta-galactosidase [Pontiella agarivorans]